MHIIPYTYGKEDVNHVIPEVIQSPCQTTEGFIVDFKCHCLVVSVDIIQKNTLKMMLQRKTLELRGQLQAVDRPVAVMFAARHFAFILIVIFIHHLFILLQQINSGRCRETV